MRILRLFDSARAHQAVLNGAAWLVPEWRRAEWLAEWKSELWYVWQARQGESALAFCLGAFYDALWIRRNAGVSERIHSVLRLEAPESSTMSAVLLPEPPVAYDLLHIASPAQCLFFLTALAVLAVSVAFLLPTARQALLPSPYADARHLALLAPSWYGSAENTNSLFDPFPSVSVQEFRELRDRPLANLAFYQPARMRVAVANGNTVTLSVARASATLFDVLRIPVANAHASRTEPGFVFSAEGWHKYFAANPRLSGDIIQVNGRPARVIGVLGAHAWQLPGVVDGWLLEGEQEIASLPARSRGFVVVRLGTEGMGATGSTGGFDSISLTDRNNRLFFMFLRLLLLACVILPMTTSLEFGDFPAKGSSSGRGRWAFLAAKVAILLPVVFFGALDLASIGQSISPILMQCWLWGSVFALRWALLDQRRRCPVCLRLLANPVRIGQSSRMLLEWHGIELICLKGHGLMHVPAKPAIWFTSRRWVNLDSSWSGLFP